MKSRRLPRTGDAIVVIITDDRGIDHQAYLWPVDDDPDGARAEANAIEAIRLKAGEDQANAR